MAPNSDPTMPTTPSDADAQSETSVVSFVVRFTQEAGAGGPSEARMRWRGRIRHVQTNAEISFAHFPEAMDFMAQHLDAGERPRPASPEPTISATNPMREGYRLWEQMVNRYVETVVDTMGRGAENSVAFRRQVDRAVQDAMRAWQPPQATASADQRQVLDALRKLQADMAMLAAKVEVILANQSTPPENDG